MRSICYPLRESAQRTLIEAHLAEGNLVEGRRSFEAYRELLARELGTEPGQELAAMVSRPARQRQKRESVVSSRYLAAVST